MNQRFGELAEIAQNNEDVALQLKSELALDPLIDRIREEAELSSWADNEADSYLVINASPADDRLIDQLAGDIDF